MSGDVRRLHIIRFENVRSRELSSDMHSGLGGGAEDSVDLLIVLKADAITYGCMSRTWQS